MAIHHYYIVFIRIQSLKYDVSNLEATSPALSRKFAPAAKARFGLSSPLERFFGVVIKKESDVCVFFRLGTAGIVSGASELQYAPKIFFIFGGFRKRHLRAGIGRIVFGHTYEIILGLVVLGKS